MPKRFASFADFYPVYLAMHDDPTNRGLHVAGPTTLAMRNGSAYLRSLPDANPKVILLATDCIPTCGQTACTSAPANCSDDANAIAAVQAVHDLDKIPTFVVGIDALGMYDATLTSLWLEPAGFA